jgi:signal transduction histidine kinase
MTLFGRWSRQRRMPTAGEVVPLRDRIAYMESLRAAVGAVVLAAVALGAADRGQPELVVWVTAVYLVVSLLPVAARRADPVRLLPFANGMLIVDGIYLAWVMLQTGGPFSPLRSLLFVHVIVVTLLVSYRTGLKVTAWQSLLFIAMTEAAAAGFGVSMTDRDAGDATLVAILTTAALWAIAVSTATFSAINERALRRQNAQLAHLSEMTQRIDETDAASDVPPVVLKALQEAFGFTRGVVIASPRDELQVLAGMGLSDPPPVVADGSDPLMSQAWLQREPTLVRRLDPTVDTRLATLLPEATNVVIVPLFLPKGYRLGMIVLEHARARGAMRRRELMLLSQFSAHAALALHNAWLMEERAAKLAEIQSLQREIVAHNAQLEIAVAERTEQLGETITELERVDGQRRHLLQGLVRAQEDERTRLANDIHDDPLQKLVSIKMRVELLQRAGDHAEELSEIHDTMRSCITSLRFMLFDLRPPILDERGLAPALERFIEQSAFEATTSIRDEVTSQIDPETRVVLYRIAQETLTNAKKHADASHIAIRLQERDGGIQMRISDDGVGFRLEDVAEARAGHLGLGSMRERAEMAGGWCTLYSLPGAGTTLEVWLPPVGPAGVASSADPEVVFLHQRPA